MNIRAYHGRGDFAQIRTSFNRNWIHYLQEALGLGIFMISACFFGGLLESDSSSVHFSIPYPMIRRIIMGMMMGSTALFIFYSPLTAPSGSHINPAVTITFFRLGKMSLWDTFFYILFQFTGSILAVYLMAGLMGELLTSAPVHYVVTVPGQKGPLLAAITELIIAFCMMLMVLMTSTDERLKKYTRMISAVFVCLFVILAVPLSGFGMNPARSFASALPAHIYTAFWIYLIMPFTGMLLAAELFLSLKKKFHLKDVPMF